MNVDGFGDRANKVAKYREFTHDGTHFRRGFKLFYEEDVGAHAAAQRARAAAAAGPRRL